MHDAVLCSYAIWSIHVCISWCVDGGVGVAVRIRELLGPGVIEIHHHIGQTMTGLGYHGHIALLVYVREWLVQEGICECSRAVKYVRWLPV